MFLHTFCAGLVYLTNPETGESSPGGSCAAFGDRSHWLTAAHCVPGGMEVTVLRGGLFQHPVRAVEVVRHPAADLAMIRVSLENDTAPAGLEENFYTVPPHELAIGSDFIGSAYPVAGQQPVERVLKGYFQRPIWNHLPASGGASYNAFEMSVPALRGSSGAVLAYAHRHRSAVAVVTENQASYITVSSFQEVEDGGAQYRELHQEVVSYGVALSLSGYGEWLATTVS